MPLDAAELEFRRKAWLALAPIYYDASPEAVEAGPPDDFMPMESTTEELPPANAAPVESIQPRIVKQTAAEVNVMSKAKTKAKKASKPKKASQPKASKPPPKQTTSKPPKPYSAYNIFFRLERMYILHQNNLLDQDTYVAAASSAHLDPIEHPRPARYASLPLPPMWYSSISRLQAEKSRSHKKRQGGSMTKAEINALVSEGWRGVDEEIFRYCKRVALAEKNRRMAEDEARASALSRVCVGGETTRAEVSSPVDYSTSPLVETSIVDSRDISDAMSTSSSDDNGVDTARHDHFHNDVGVAAALLMLNQKTHRL